MQGLQSGGFIDKLGQKYMDLARPRNLPPIQDNKNKRLGDAERLTLTHLMAVILMWSALLLASVAAFLVELCSRLSNKE